MKIVARQGDILVLKINRLPEGTKPIKDHVVAFGEATGHAHVLEGDDVVVLELPNHESRFAHVGSKATLVHRQLGDGPVSDVNFHGPKILFKGIYELRRQEEYVPGDIPRTVID